MITKKEKPVKKSTCYFAQKPHVKFLIYASAPKNPHLSKASSRTQKRKIKLQSSRKLCFVMPSYFCNSRGQSLYDQSKSKVEVEQRILTFHCSTSNFALKPHENSPLGYFYSPLYLSKRFCKAEMTRSFVSLRTFPKRDIAGNIKSPSVPVVFNIPAFSALSKNFTVSSAFRRSFSINSVKSRFLRSSTKPSRPLPHQRRH